MLTYIGLCKIHHSSAVNLFLSNMFISESRYGNQFCHPGEFLDQAENSFFLSFSLCLCLSLAHTHTHTHPTRAHTHIYRHPKGNSSLAHPILNSALTQSEGGTLAPLRGQSCKVVETETSCPTSPLALTLGTWAVAIIPHGPPDPEPPPQAHALRRDKRAPVAMYLTGQFFLNQGKVPWVCVACTAPGIPSSVLVTAFQE